MSAAPLNAILKIGFGPLKDKIVSYDILDKNSLGDIFNHTEAFFRIRMEFYGEEILLQVSRS